MAGDLETVVPDAAASESPALWDQIEARHWHMMHVLRSNEDAKMNQSFDVQRQVLQAKFLTLEEERAGLLKRLAIIEAETEDATSGIAALDREVQVEADALAQRREEEDQKKRLWFLTYRRDGTAYRQDGEGHQADEDSMQVDQPRPAHVNGSSKSEEPANVAGEEANTFSAAAAVLHSTPVGSSPAPQSTQSSSSRHGKGHANYPSFKSSESTGIDIIGSQGERLGEIYHLEIDNPYVNRALQLPTKRHIQLRPGRSMSAESVSGIYAPSEKAAKGDAQPKGAKWLSCMIQAKGDVYSHPCTTCADRIGVFHECVKISEEDGNGLFPRCGNCEWNRRGCQGAADMVRGSLAPALAAAAPPSAAAPPGAAAGPDAATTASYEQGQDGDDNMSATRSKRRRASTFQTSSEEKAEEKADEESRATHLRPRKSVAHQTLSMSASPQVSTAASPYNGFTPANHARPSSSSKAAGLNGLKRLTIASSPALSETNGSSGQLTGSSTNGSGGGVVATSHEDAANQFGEITKATLALRDNGVVFTEPLIMRGIPIAKIDENHPYWDPDWADVWETTRATMESYRAKLEEYDERQMSMDKDGQKTDSAKNSLSSSYRAQQNQNYNRGVKVLKLLPAASFHPYQLVSKAFLSKQHMLGYDVLFRIAQVLEELAKFKMDVTPLEWLRQRLHEVYSEDPDSFKLIKTINDMYHDPKLVLLREKNGFGTIGRRHGSSSFRHNSSKVSVSVSASVLASAGKKRKSGVGGSTFSTPTPKSMASPRSVMSGGGTQDPSFAEAPASIKNKTKQPKEEAQQKTTNGASSSSQARPRADKRSMPADPGVQSGQTSSFHAANKPSGGEPSEKKSVPATMSKSTIGLPTPELVSENNQGGNSGDKNANGYDSNSDNDDDLPVRRHGQRPKRRPSSLVSGEQVQEPPLKRSRPNSSSMAMPTPTSSKAPSGGNEQSISLMTDSDLDYDTDHDGYTSMDSYSGDRIYKDDFKIVQVKHAKEATNPLAVQYYHLYKSSAGLIFEHQVPKIAGNHTEWGLYQPPIEFHLRPSEVVSVTSAPGSLRVMLQTQPIQGVAYRGDIMVHFMRDRSKRRFLAYLKERVGTAQFFRRTKEHMEKIWDELVSAEILPQ